MTIAHSPESGPPLASVTGALHEVSRALTAADWRVVDLTADGDTVSLRLRFTGTAGTPVATLSREGDHWSLEWAGSVLRLRHCKGLSYLHALLSSPGIDLHALQLSAVEGPGAPPADHDPELTAGGCGGTGPLLDETAKNAYRRRLADLREEVADAEQCHDPERAERARSEIDALTAELARAFGLGGRARPACSPAERARVNTTRALRAVISRLTRDFPDLGHHLDTSVNTGTFSGYHPGPHPPVAWRLRRPNTVHPR
ncbi:hypothetical protein AB0A74_13450 [Saccharothrix sp. NPDC042600]|uniref:hypothetical protein n=1 Tax=Saccharothrix TaxID=2071 RepID=UPI0033F62739|nr:hypothetical protein GCM10017745_38150 [Saccharothrix mutabilis subsp. capreolus]